MNCTPVSVPGAITRDPCGVFMLEHCVATRFSNRMNGKSRKTYVGDRCGFDVTNELISTRSGTSPEAEIYK